MESVIDRNADLGESFLLSISMLKSPTIRIFSVLTTKFAKKSANSDMKVV